MEAEEEEEDMVDFVVVVEPYGLSAHTAYRKSRIRQLRSMRTRYTA